MKKKDIDFEWERNLWDKESWQDYSYDLEDKLQKTVNALNRIGMIGKGKDAYSKEFTEKVMLIVQETLSELEK